MSLQPMSPGPDPGACPRCGEWRKAGMIHRCPAATPDPPREEWRVVDGDNVVCRLAGHRDFGTFRPWAEEQCRGLVERFPGESFRIERRVGDEEWEAWCPPDTPMGSCVPRCGDARCEAATSPDPPKCADCERLRQQNHEAAARRDRENAQRDARLAEYENNVARGMKAVEHLRADWTTDPPSQEPGGFWRYASQNAREAIVAAYEAGKTDAAASPDERLREAGERLSNLVTLLGGYDGPGYLAAPNQGEHPDYYAAAKLFDRIMRDEKTGAAVVLAQWRAALAAADREAPDEEEVR